MNLLKTLVDDLGDILIKNGIEEAVDIRISNLDNYDYQINNLVKFQNHPNIIPKSTKHHPTSTKTATKKKRPEIMFGSLGVVELGSRCGRNLVCILCVSVRNL